MQLIGMLTRSAREVSSPLCVSGYPDRPLLSVLQLRVAFAAVNRSVGSRLEGDFGLFAASGADGGEKLTLRLAAGGLSGVAAFLASLRLVLEASLGVELLLAGGKDEFLAAFLALECFVLIHDRSSLWI